MNRGFTLVEAIIVVAISALAFGALANLIFTFYSLRGFEVAYIATAGSAGTAMNALETTILPASHILSSRAFYGATYSSATTSLVLELPTVDASGNIVSGVKDYVAFVASSTKLYQFVNADAQSARRSGTTTLSSTLYSLSFTYGTADFSLATTVVADVQTRATYKQQVTQGRLTEKLYLRNYSSP